MWGNIPKQKPQRSITELSSAKGTKATPPFCHIMLEKNLTFLLWGKNKNILAIITHCKWLSSYLKGQLYFIEIRKKNNNADLIFVVFTLWYLETIKTIKLASKMSAPVTKDKFFRGQKFSYYFSPSSLKTAR